MYFKHTVMVCIARIGQGHDTYTIHIALFSRSLVARRLQLVSVWRPVAVLQRVSPLLLHHPRDRTSCRPVTRRRPLWRTLQRRTTSSRSPSRRRTSGSKRLTRTNRVSLTTRSSVRYYKWILPHCARMYSGCMTMTRRGRSMRERYV